MKKSNIIALLVVLFSGIIGQFTGFGLLIFTISGVGFCVLYSQKGPLWCVAAAAAVYLFVSFLNGNPLAGLAMIFGFALPGILSGYAFHRKSSLRSCILLSSAGSLLQYFVNFFLYQFQTGGNLYGDVFNKIQIQMTDFLTSLFQQMQNTGIDISMFEKPQAYAQLIYDLLNALIPFYLLFSCCLLAFLIIGIGKQIVYKGQPATPIQSYSRLYAPVSLMWLFLILSLIDLMYGENTQLGFLFNVILLIMAYYDLCGISVLDFFLRRTLPSKALRFILYGVGLTLCFLISAILPVFNPFILLLGVGLTDSVFDFRKIRPRRNWFNSER